MHQDCIYRYQNVKYVSLLAPYHFLMLPNDINMSESNILLSLFNKYNAKLDISGIFFRVYETPHFLAYPERELIITSFTYIESEAKSLFLSRSIIKPSSVAIMGTTLPIDFNGQFILASAHEAYIKAIFFYRSIRSKR